jgi:hypothetical protein
VKGKFLFDVVLCCARYLQRRHCSVKGVDTPLNRDNKSSFEQFTPFEGMMMDSNAFYYADRSSLYGYFLDI